jgi:hypothetical protein
MPQRTTLKEHPTEQNCDTLTIRLANTVAKSSRLRDLMRISFLQGYNSLSPEVQSACAHAIVLKIRREMESDMHRVFRGNSYDIFNARRSADNFSDAPIVLGRDRAEARDAEEWLAC